MISNRDLKGHPNFACGHAHLICIIEVVVCHEMLASRYNIRFKRSGSTATRSRLSKRGWTGSYAISHCADQDVTAQDFAAGQAKRNNLLSGDLDYPPYNVTLWQYDANEDCSWEGSGPHCRENDARPSASGPFVFLHQGPVAPISKDVIPSCSTQQNLDTMATSLFTDK